MRQAMQAYGAVARQISDPRDLEESLLLTAAAKLQAIDDDWDCGQRNLHEALTYNRKLWTVFMTSAASRDNPLPAAIRQNIANLGLFVMNETIAITQDPQRERLGALVAINRNIAAGLRTRRQM